MNINKIFITNNNCLNYHSINKEMINYLDNYSKYINKIDGETYLFLNTAYIIRIIKLKYLLKFNKNNK